MDSGVGAERVVHWGDGVGAVHLNQTLVQRTPIREVTPVEIELAPAPGWPEIRAGQWELRFDESWVTTGQPLPCDCEVSETAALQMVASKCPHGEWHPHNALLLDDGSTIPDPENPEGCRGGTIEIEGRRYGISHMLAAYLRAFEETS